MLMKASDHLFVGIILLRGTQQTSTLCPDAGALALAMSLVCMASLPLMASTAECVDVKVFFLCNRT